MDRLAALEARVAALEERAAGAALTPRRREVLALLATGRTTAEIAAALGVSEHAVRQHCTALYAALGARSRAQAVAEAWRRGLVRGDREEAR